MQRKSDLFCVGAAPYITDRLKERRRVCVKVCVHGLDSVGISFKVRAMETGEREVEDISFYYPLSPQKTKPEYRVATPIAKLLFSWMCPLF